MSDYSDLAGLKQYIKNNPLGTLFAQVQETILDGERAREAKSEWAKLNRAEMYFYHLVSILVSIKHLREGVPYDLGEHMNVKLERKKKQRRSDEVHSRVLRWHLVLREVPKFPGKTPAWCRQSAKSTSRMLC